MGVSMYKSSSLPPLSMWNRCQESFLHFRSLIGFRWNTKAKLWAWAHSSSTSCTPGFISTHGTSCLTCCLRSGQKISFCCAPLHPPISHWKSILFFPHICWTYSLFLDRSRAVERSKRKNRQKYKFLFLSFHQHSLNFFHVFQVRSSFCMPYVTRIIPHCIAMSSYWGIHFSQSILWFFRILHIYMLISFRSPRISMPSPKYSFISR